MYFKEKMNTAASTLSKRFRGLLPIVIDVETSGLNPATDAMLEMATVTLTTDTGGNLTKLQTVGYHIEPFQGANIEPQALAINHIDPSQPLRYPIPEEQVLHRLFALIQEQLEIQNCYRAILVGHNAWFDLSFILAAVARCGMKHIPLHRFTTFDTASLAAIALGETVLARAARRARIPFDIQQAHSAIYDVERTAELFCHIANRWK